MLLLRNSVFSETINSDLHTALYRLKIYILNINLISNLIKAMHVSNSTKPLRFK